MIKSMIKDDDNLMIKDDDKKMMIRKRIIWRILNIFSEPFRKRDDLRSFYGLI